MAARSSTVDDLRRANLATVLERVHRGGPLSRAQLTADTGLNRSTIGALVAELEQLGLVVAGEPDPTNRVGRPSPAVAVATGPAVIAVNPELDAITVALVGLGARVERVVRFEVDHAVTPDEAVGQIARLVAELRADAGPRRVRGIGLAVPGLVRAGDGLVRWAPHLGWTDIPLPKLVTEATGLPALAANDASLGALAEHLFGAGRGVDELVYLNGGASGIGGGVIAGGRALGGVGGYAGEFGQNRPGVSGTLEDQVSRARLLAVLGIASADEPTLEAALLASRSPAVLAELDRQRQVLATALSNAVNVLNPELLVLGGFLASVLASDPAALERLVAQQAIPAAIEGVGIRPAALGTDRLLIGAAELAWAPILADPAAS